MIDDDKDKDDLELDLEGALDSWEADFENAVEPESSPMPQTAPPPPAAARQPLYRPDPELERRAAAQRRSPTPVASPSKLTPEELRRRFPGFDEEANEDDDSSTRVASVPEELMAALANLEEPEHPTAPPPGGGVDLDLEDLLDEMEADTSMRAIEPPPAARRPDERTAEEAIEALDREEILDPFHEESDREDRGEEGEPEAAIDDLLFAEDEPVPSPPSQPDAAPPLVPPPAFLTAPPSPAPDAAKTLDAQPSAYKPKPPSAYKPPPPPGFAPSVEAHTTAAPASAPPEEPLRGDERPPPVPHSDEPQLTIQDDDEPQLLSEDDDDLDLGLPPAPPSIPGTPEDDLGALAPPPRSDPTAAAPEGDHGAETARRTVAHRKPRVETYALVGRDPETQRRRADLLRTLGERSTGVAAARAQLAAAEILQRLGEDEEARELFQRAREAAPRELMVLRSLRREAAAQADWPRAAELLEAELALELSPSDRAHALLLLSEIRLHPLGDPEGAEEAARAAQDAQPSVAAGLLLLEARQAQGRAAETFVALQQTASTWSDPAAAAALLEMAGHLAERAGRRERAHEAYAEAAARGASFGARLGAARTAEQAPRSALLASAAGALATPALAEVFRRLAAVLASDDEAALSAIGEAKRPMSLRTKAEIARRLGLGELRAATLEELAAATGTTERALALVDLAETRAEAGDLDAAEQALRDAALADPALDMVHVVREVLARKAGDPDRLARAVDAESDGGGALQAAAKVARGGELALERDWLERAAARGEAPIAADVLGLDAAAEAGDDEALAAALRRQADRAKPDQRLGPLVELAAMDAGEQRVNLWREALAEARPLVALRALARALANEEPAEAAALLLEEAERAEPFAAFQALLEAGRALARAGDAEGARACFERARDALGGASPASWAVDEMLAAAEDLEGWVESLRRVVDTAQTPREGADAAIRAALIELDPDNAGALLQRARELLDEAAITDPVLDSLLASAGGVDPLSRASLLESRAQAAEGAHARLLRLRAAAAFEQAGDSARAAALYREVLADAPDTMVEVSLDRAELAAGQHARVSSRRLEAVKSAAKPEDKLAALESLAALDLRERGEISSGLLTLQSILAEAPGHLPTLRALERHYLSEERDDDLIAVERALVEHLDDARDVVAPARLATRLLLLRPETPGDAADPLLRLTAERFLRGEGPAGDHWLARRVLAAARVSGNRPLQQATLRHLVAELAATPDEQAALAVPLAELTAELEDAATAAQLLAPHAAAHPAHPTVLEAQADLLRKAGNAPEAAAAFERAAGATSVDARRAELLYAAGRAWEDASDEAAALAAYEQAVDVDVTFADLFERTRRLLEAAGARDRLAALLQRRLAAGADAPTKVALYEEHAKLVETLGDRRSARDSLRAALRIEPERAGALRRLAELSLAEGDWRAAAESLIRIARLKQNREELRWVFFSLGEIYDEHMPDPKRAEAAFRRVLKLVPDDLEALDRLARLFEREQLHDKAIDVLQQLVEREIDPDERRRHQLRLAQAHERRGDLRSAEHVLEGARREQPTDLEVLRAIADLYERQGAQSALAMHLNRAVADFRRLILEDPADPTAWPGLVEVLDWRQRRDAARAVASAAIAVGMGDPGLAARVGPDGAIPGAGATAAAPELRDLLAPPALNSSVYEVFRLAADAFDKTLPFNARGWRAEKAPRSHPVRAEVQRTAQLLGVGDVQVLLTKAHDRVCLPVGDRPITLLVGEALLTETTDAERAFLFTRSLAAAGAHLSVAMRSDPADLYLLIAGLLRAYDPHHAPAGLDPHALDDVAKRVYKAIPRRHREELGPLAFEMGGAPGFDAAKLRAAAGELGDHVALLTHGTLGAALDALLKLGGTTPPTDASGRISAIRAAPEAWSLLHFALSDAYLEARRRAGCDRR